MSLADYSLMKELEAELNRGCPSGFRLSDSERERMVTLYSRLRVISPGEDAFFRRINRHGVKKSK